MKAWVILLAISCVGAAAQPVAKPAAPEKTSAKKFTPARTPDGQPDFQGVWSNATITPVERPPELGMKQFFTEKEAADNLKELLDRTNADRRDGGAAADVGRAYNNFWYDRGWSLVSTRRTSIVTDPPNDQIPLTAEAQKRVEDLRAYDRLHPADGPENRSLSERCLTWATAGPPMLPSAYNNNYQVVQIPGYFVILNEMVHDARIIPLDGRPHLNGSIRQWFGDSRGHWEGDTLVVDSINFTDKSRTRGSDEKMHLTERFTRTAADTLLYQFTVDDPTSFTRPWSGEIPSWKSEDKIYEYACHEGNYGMEGILAGARADEKADTKK